MTIPSVPIVLDKEYRLRFGQLDLIAIEEKLGPVFTLFTPEKLGISVARVLVWRGLHRETERGELVHVFPMTTKGLEAAGDFVLAYVQEGGGTFPELFDKLAPGFAAAIGLKPAGTGGTEEEPQETTGKNLQAPPS